jgi:uncharacterized protein YjbJ (UPF0337 family)
LVIAKTHDDTAFGLKRAKRFAVASGDEAGASRSIPMKDSAKDQIKGKFHEAKGKVKEAAADLTNNPNLKAEGQNEQVDGTIQKKVGQVKKVFGA